MNSMSESKQVKHLSISQKQAIIKLLEKSNKDQRFICDWRPISLLNLIKKLISKTLAAWLKRPSVFWSLPNSEFKWKIY